MKRKLFLFLLVGLAFSMAGLQPAQAIEFGLDYVYDGATPEGDRPWLIARFTDGTGPDEGVVRLTLDAGNLTESQKIGGFWFNIDPPDPFLPFLDFEFEYIESLSDPPDDPLKSIASGVDARKAGSADGFDIEILFNTSNGNGKNDGSKFGGGKTIVYDITAIFEDPSTGSDGPYDLFASYFDEQSNPDTGPGPFYAAAHILSIGEDDGPSGWIADNPNAVPESSTLLLLGVGLIGLAGFGRRRIKS